MNRILAETLTLMNGVIAIVIVIMGGYFGRQMPIAEPYGVLIGAVAGLLVAALACGVIAYLALIERHLARIAGTSGGSTPRTATDPDRERQGASRREPTL